MKQNVTEYMFKDEFRKIRPDNFSWGGLSALYNYLRDYEDDVGQELELDVIAICCDFTEYKDFNEIKIDYDVQNEVAWTVDEDDVKEWLSSRTHYIEHDEGVIIRNF